MLVYIIERAISAGWMFMEGNNGPKVSRNWKDVHISCCGILPKSLFQLSGYLKGGRWLVDWYSKQKSCTVYNELLE